MKKLTQVEEPKVETELSLTGDNAEVSLEDLSKEQLISLITQLLSEAEADSTPQKYTYLTEPFIEEGIDLTDEYLEGAKIGRKLVGLLSTLVSGGYAIEIAQDICVNQHTYEHSATIIKEQSKVSKRASGLA